MTAISTEVHTLKRLLDNEVIKALALPQDGWLRRVIDPLYAKATYTLAELGVRFNRHTARHGLPEAARRILPRFVAGFQANGAVNIPREGPLVIAANHPGTYDTLLIAASLKRNDLKIISSIIPFFQHLPSVKQRLIFSPPRGQVAARMETVRQAIHHLTRGGALLIYPSGHIDPDPSFMPGAEEEIGSWSRSLEYFLRKIPQARLLISIVSGVLAPGCVHHPLTHLRRNRVDRQRIGEMLQVIRQMIFDVHFPLCPQVTFGEPIAFRKPDIDMAGEKIIASARQLLNWHQNHPGLPCSEKA